MISQKRVTTNQKKGGTTMYTLKETQQIIRENPYTIMFPTKEYTLLEDIMEILESTDNTRTFTITSKHNSDDYSYPATDYYITELPTQKIKGEK